MALTYEEYLLSIRDIEMGLTPIYSYIHRSKAYSMPPGSIKKIEEKMDSLRSISAEEFAQKEKIKTLCRALKKDILILCGLTGYTIPDRLIGIIDNLIQFL